MLNHHLLKILLYLFLMPLHLNLFSFYLVSEILLSLVPLPLKSPIILLLLKNNLLEILINQPILLHLPFPLFKSLQSFFDAIIHCLFDVFLVDYLPVLGIQRLLCFLTSCVDLLLVVNLQLLNVSYAIFHYLIFSLYYYISLLVLIETKL